MKGTSLPQHLNKTNQKVFMRPCWEAFREGPVCVAALVNNKNGKGRRGMKGNARGTTACESPVVPI